MPRKQQVPRKKQASDSPVWYQLEAQAVAEVLNTNLDRGLTEAEAEARLLHFGPNQFRERKRKSAIALLIDQFRDFMVLVLLAATAVSFLLGEHVDGIAIVVIVILNAILGFIQEVRAEQSTEALRHLTAPTAHIMRNGKRQEIAAKDVVPGDILLIEAGDRIAADARLFEVANLQAEEAALTGESLPVSKRVHALDGDRGPGDQRNMLFQGTVATRGRGRGLVVATGMDTLMGQIAGLMDGAGETQTPLQRRLEQLGRVLLIACLAISAAVVLGGIWQGQDPYTMFLSGVSLAVAAIPEGLPAIVTIALAIGVQRMIRINAIIRRLPAVETLGCATVICSDKTGTVTSNSMTVRRVYAGGQWYEVTGQGYGPEGEFRDGHGVVDPLSIADLRETICGGALCCNAQLQQANRGTWSVSGDPTEGALLALANKGGLLLEHVLSRFQRVGELPFDSERKRMSVWVEGREGRVLYVKGAPDLVLARCRAWRRRGRELPLTEAHRRAVLAANEQMAGSALRVLAIARRAWPGAVPEEGDADEIEQDLVFLGLVGMIDPPRPEVRKAIEECHAAGLKAVMITGDHRLTAEAIAKELHLLPPGGRILTGPELDVMSEQALERAVEDTYVFARVSPAHKLRIVRAFKAQGEIVAMTGDGVNDAPAVKEADIGVAMGQTGTDVTKEASAMILTDDNFATIVAAIREGRAIYDNIRKFIRYLLACNTGEILVMLLATLLALPLPLLPIQMLLVNLVTDGLPALALGVDPAAEDVMRRPPRDPKESVFSRGLGRKILLRGGIIGVATLGVFVLELVGSGNVELARTMATATLVLSQLFHSFDARSEKYGIWQIPFFNNLALVGAVGSSLAVFATVIYVPPLQAAFHTLPLNATQWGLVLATASLGAVLGSFQGWFRRRVLKRVVLSVVSH